MRIGIVTSDSFFSYLLISDLVRQRHRDIVCFVITPSKVKGKGTLGSIIHVLRKTGLRNLTYKVVAGLWVHFADVLHKIGIIRHCITPSSVAKRYGIDLYRSRDCNDNETLCYLRRREIDIILSINVYQRMLEPLLSLPNIAAVNSHFGLLPRYRGMAPYIWAMAQGENEIGLSVHHMVLEFDEGRLIRQERMQLKSNDSAMGVYIRGCLIARKMITEAVDDLQKDPNSGFGQKGEGSYFSMPTKKCIADLYRRGYCLWRVRNLLSLLRSNVGGERLP